MVRRPAGPRSSGFLDCSDGSPRKSGPSSPRHQSTPLDERSLLPEMWNRDRDEGRTSIVLSKEQDAPQGNDDTHKNGNDDSHTQIIHPYLGNRTGRSVRVPGSVGRSWKASVPPRYVADSQARQSAGKPYKRGSASEYGRYVYF